MPGVALRAVTHQAHAPPLEAGTTWSIVRSCLRLQYLQVGASCQACRQQSTTDAGAVHVEMQWWDVDGRQGFQQGWVAVCFLGEQKANLHWIEQLCCSSLARQAVSQHDVAAAERDPAVVVPLHIHPYAQHGWQHELGVGRVGKDVIVLQHIHLQQVGL